MVGRVIAACIFILPVFIQNLSGQNPDNCTNVVEGVVYDLNSNEPIPFVTVQIENTTSGAVANEKGAFRIENVCENEFNLVVSHIGYKKTGFFFQK